MVITLLAGIVISIVCWAWGNAVFHFSRLDSDKQLPHFSIVCLTGFAVLTVIGSYVSLWTHIGSPVFLVVLALALLFLHRQKKVADLKKNFLQSIPVQFSFLLLLIVSSLLVLLMCAWQINHPDTVDYHAAIINSIKEKGIIKGYANENIRYGLQSFWFVASALFSVDFFSPGVLTFANSVVLFWFLLFMVDRIAHCYKHQLYSYAFFLVFLLSLAFWDYTQIRLTATSAAPDFIAAIFILLSIYLFIQQQNIRASFFLTLLFGITAITLKLSSFPLGFLLLYHLFICRSTQAFFSSVFVLLIALLPFLLRNYFTSGYILFPGTIFQWPLPRWQVKAADVHEMQRYITAYARMNSPAEKDAVDHVLSLPYHKWLPVWWSLRYTGQKALLLVSLATFCLGMVYLKKIVRRARSRHSVSLLITLIGLVFWFLLGPDPRFGTAWLILLNALLLPLVLTPKTEQWFSGKLVAFSAYFLSAFLFVYMVYRVMRFFDPINLLLPSGIL